MTIMADGPEGINAKPLTVLERYYEWPLHGETLKNGVENDLIGKFYESMVSYVVNRLDEGDISTAFKETGSGRQPSEMAGGRSDTVVRIAYESGNVFEGTLFQWIAQGTGRLFVRDGGVTYEGQFSDGLPEGTGLVKWPDSSWYEGEFRRGLRHGRGLHVSAEDGRRWYSGQWTDGKRNGTGQTGCRAGESDGALNYAGDWLNNRPHGHGTGSWPDGTWYDGDWADGLPHGRGKVVWPNNDVFDGDWADGLMDGTGVYEWNSNPQDGHRLVVCSCDRYVGQWSRSKRHGAGVFYSTDTGRTVHGRWTDDALDGPCDIVLSTGRRPNHTDLVFRRNVLYGTRPSAPAVVRGASRYPPGPAAHRGRRPPAARRNKVHPGTTEPTEAMAYDLSGHVRRTSDKCANSAAQIDFRRATSSTTAITTDSDTELRAAELALGSYLGRLRDLYGAFSADGCSPVIVYRTHMTRLGLWRMLIDYGLHARVSLVDFGELLYENKDYAFESAHDPFEIVHFWQFVHVVCELATAMCDGRDTRVKDAGDDASLAGVWASAFRRLLTENLKADVVPISYAAHVGDGGERWMDSRKTVETMYDVYRTFGSSPPTARQLIQLYGPRLAVGDYGVPSRLDSALPVVLDALLTLGNDQSETVTLFGFTVDTVVTLLADACPRIVDSTGLLVDVETRLVFAEWYRFVLLCARDCRRVPAAFAVPSDDDNSLRQESP